MTEKHAIIVLRKLLEINQEEEQEGNFLLFGDEVDAIELLLEKVTGIKEVEHVA